MENGEAIVWGSLVVLMIGFCLHRMGPAFERGRVGPPLILLGITCLVLLPAELVYPEDKLIQSFFDLLPWASTFFLGAILALRASSNYGISNPYILSLGWVLIALSWYIFINFSDPISLHSILGGLWASLGVFSGLLAFGVGVVVAEQMTGLDSESAPLSEKESSLVRIILERRLGGD